jgi:DNA polymerase-4
VRGPALRTVFHVDMDAFFVSVEELLDPTLKGKPVVVGGQAGQRGVVSAASYAARKFGVHSALPLRTAAKLCPQSIFLDGHPHLYREYSHKVHAVLLEFSPQVEMASVDEAYMDLTGSERLLGPPLRAAHALHERMKQRTGLNCSIGISTSRMVSKVASDQAKPNGILWVQPGLEAAFLAPLDVRKLPGVGKVTEQKLHEIGIRKVGGLARLDEDFLLRRFGQWGLALAGKSHGADAGAWFDGEIGDEQDAKSISHEHTFDVDTSDAEVLEATLARLTGKVARRLREHGFHARTVHLKLRYKDFSTLTRARTLDHATQLDHELITESRALFRKAWKPGAAVRLIGIGVSGFDETEGQLDLLNAERNERARRVLSAADRLRDKFGEKIVTTASGLTGDTPERVHENPVGLPGKGPKRGAHS